jgi:hypothetical protein
MLHLPQIKSGVLIGTAPLNFNGCAGQLLAIALPNQIVLRIDLVC